MPDPTKIGIRVTCTVCGDVKQPRGRSAAMCSSYCNSHDCDGYRLDPKPGDLWWGETDADFGYACGDNATRPMTAAEIAKWRDSLCE